MTIFNLTIKRICSSKIKLILLFLSPVLFTAMFISTVQSSMSIIVVDNDGTELSKRLISGMESLDSRIRVVPADGGQAMDKIVSYQTDMAITIQKGFEEDLLAGKDPAVEEYHIVDKQGVFYVNAYIDGFVADMKTLAAGSANDREAFGKALAKYAENRLSVQDWSENDNDMRERARGSLGFLVQCMLYMSIITAGIILEDRSSGVYYRTFFAPVSLRRYFAENLLAFLAIGALQAAISLSLLITVFGMQYGSLPAVYVLFTVFALVCVALGMWLITLFRKPLMAYLSILFLTTPLVMLGGCYWPASFMPDILIKISKFMPTTWVMQAVDKVLNDGAGLAGIGLEIMVLFLFTAVFMAAGLVKKVDISK